MIFALHTEGQFRFKPGFKQQNHHFVEVSTAFSNLPSLKGSGWGLQIRKAGASEALVSFREDANLIPASNMKLITSINGFHNLGPEFRFKTIIWIDGPIDNGVLKGNVFVEGSGDPTIYAPDREKFSENFFHRLIVLLKKAGIKKIEGAVLEKKFSHPYSGLKNDWAWADIGNYYGAGIYPLNINENMYQLWLSATKKGESAKIVATDTLTDITIDEVDVATENAGTPDFAYIFWKAGATGIDVKGSVPAEKAPQKIKGSIQNPSHIFLKVLLAELKNSGIETGTKRLGTGVFTSIGKIESPPLSQICKEVNLFSNNLMTEAIAFALARPESKLDENGWTHLDRFAREANFSPGYYFADGSGLSLSNRISPGAICQALQLARKQPYFDTFIETLPISGVSGTMKSFCNSPAAKGKIRAKSGTLNRVLCYSGYVDSKSGPLIFSVLVNSYSGNFFAMKKELEKLLTAMVTIQ